MLFIACVALAASTALTPDLSGFSTLPQDPPPKQTTRGNHYWVSNEERPELFRADLEAVGGGGVWIGVGAEQNYIFAGWARPDVLVLMDFDEQIPDLHRAYASVFKRAETKEDFMARWVLKRQKELVAAVKEDWADPLVSGRIISVLKEARATVRVHNERITEGFVERKVPTLFTDDDQYAFVRKLFLDGRVFMVRGDLTATQTMLAIAEAAKKAKLMVRGLYMSNAEQYFKYTPEFRANMLALPFDEKGLVIRTIAWPQFGFAKDGGQYHYSVQNGLSFQSWVADAKTAQVQTILSAATRKSGFSRILDPPSAEGEPAPAASSTAVPIADAPAVIPCSAAPPKDMACVPGGPFLRGVNQGERGAERVAMPKSTVWQQTFNIDKNEVTFAEYKECEAAGKCKKAGPNYVDFSAPKQPMTGVTWFDAVDYCKWRGKRLPTEAEWEKAARGTDGRVFPWGNEPANCDRAVIMTAAGRSCGKKQASKNHPDTGRPEPVGSKPPTQHGLYDMAGNSWEWVADWMTPSWSACGKDCAGVNPKGPCAGATPCPGFEERVVRSGSWYWPAAYATTTHRRGHTPTNQPVFHHFGFRCAADVGAAK